MVQIFNFIEGWAKYLVGFTSELSRERLKKCVDCEHAIEATYEDWLPDSGLKEVKGLVCNKCHCPLSAKLRANDEKCPLNKW